MNSPVVRAIKALFFIGPLLFGVAFLSPLVAQSMVALAITPPFGLEPLVFGLIIGTGLGVTAQIRGRWI
ncbi:MAG: hypothetical protein AAGJ32_10645 [Pseudomonadota bacterium]